MLYQDIYHTKIAPHAVHTLDKKPINFEMERKNATLIIYNDENCIFKQMNQKLRCVLIFCLQFQYVFALNYSTYIETTTVAFWTPTPTPAATFGEYAYRFHIALPYHIDAMIPLLPRYKQAVATVANVSTDHVDVLSLNPITIQTQSATEIETAVYMPTKKALDNVNATFDRNKLDQVLQNQGLKTSVPRIVVDEKQNKTNSSSSFLQTQKPKEKKINTMLLIVVGISVGFLTLFLLLCLFYGVVADSSQQYKNISSSQDESVQTDDSLHSFTDQEIPEESNVMTSVDLESATIKISNKKL